MVPAEINAWEPYVPRPPEKVTNFNCPLFHFLNRLASHSQPLGPGVFAGVSLSPLAAVQILLLPSADSHTPAGAPMLLRKTLPNLLSHQNEHPSHPRLKESNEPPPPSAKRPERRRSVLPGRLGGLHSGGPGWEGSKGSTVQPHPTRCRDRIVEAQTGEETSPRSQ